MAPRRTKQHDIEIIQNSPLTNLPPEIRNSIYEFVASDTTSICLRNESIAYTPPLSLVCRQIREEFEGIYYSEAPKYAGHVNISITNFIHKDVMPCIERLPAFESKGERNIKLRIHLTNTFDNYLSHLRELDWGIETNELDANGKAVHLDCEYDVVIDHKTFDVECARQVVVKLRWALGSPNLLQHHAQWAWTKIDKAFGRAFERYNADVASIKAVVRGRKRKAKADSGAAAIEPASRRKRV